MRFSNCLFISISVINRQIHVLVSRVYLYMIKNYSYYNKKMPRNHQSQYQTHGVAYGNMNPLGFQANKLNLIHNSETKTLNSVGMGSQCSQPTGNR